jgi:signal peptidase I
MTSRGGPSPASARGDRGRFSFLRGMPGLFVMALVLALLLKTFAVQAFSIPSESMEPTLQIGDRVLVNKVTYRFHPPRRGDIIVFSDPHAAPVHRNPASAFIHWLVSGIGFNAGSPTDYIKRVIGLPGDRVQLIDGVVYVNGKALAPEPYLDPSPGPPSYGPVTVPKGSLFVMGDNRGHSGDSRTILGFIPLDRVVGRAFVIVWAPSHWRWLSTPAYRSV